MRRSDGGRAGTRAAALLLLVFLTGAAACGTARRGEPLTGPHRLADPVLLRGERTFAVHCSQCHPGGEAGLGPAVNNKPLPTWLIRFQVRNGLGVMPAFSRERISPRELDELILYMKELRRQRPAGLQAARGRLE
jgi:mono/diheme cytochrome c family protein